MPNEYDPPAPAEQEPGEDPLLVEAMRKARDEAGDDLAAFEELWPVLWAQARDHQENIQTLKERYKASGRYSF